MITPKQLSLSIAGAISAVLLLGQPARALTVIAQPYLLSSWERVDAVQPIDHGRWHASPSEELCPPAPSSFRSGANPVPPQRACWEAIPPRPRASCQSLLFSVWCVAPSKRRLFVAKLRICCPLRSGSRRRDKHAAEVPFRCCNSAKQ
jgi:hypothetical protein